MVDAPPDRRRAGRRGTGSGIREVDREGRARVSVDERKNSRSTDSRAFWPTTTAGHPGIGDGGKTRATRASPQDTRSGAGAGPHLRLRGCETIFTHKPRLVKPRRRGLSTAAAGVVAERSRRTTHACAPGFRPYSLKGRRNPTWRSGEWTQQSGGPGEPSSTGRDGESIRLWTNLRRGDRCVALKRLGRPASTGGMFQGPPGHATQRSSCRFAASPNWGIPRWEFHDRHAQVIADPDTGVRLTVRR